MVAPENDDAELVCRASNPWFPSDIIEDKRIINVACKLSQPISRTNDFYTILWLYTNNTQINVQ